MPPAIEPEELYRRLGRIIETAPSPLEDGPLPPDVMNWVGDASALIQLTGDLTFSAESQIAINGLHHSNRIVNFQKLLMILHKARSLTALDIPPGGLILSDGTKPIGPTGPPGKADTDLRGLNGPTGPSPRRDVPPQGATALGPAGFPVGASTDPNPPFIPREPAADATGAARLRKIEADYENLMARAALLEAAVSSLLSVGESAIGIGHNRGPSDFEPVSVDDLVEINQLIALLKEQGPIPPTNPAPILDLQAKTGKTATKVKEYVEDVGKAAAKGFGEEIGKRLAQSPFWIALYHQMGQVSEALIVWLTNIPH